MRRAEERSRRRGTLWPKKSEEDQKAAREAHPCRKTMDKNEEKRRGIKRN